MKQELGRRQYRNRIEEDKGAEEIEDKNATTEGGSARSRNIAPGGADGSSESRSMWQRAATATTARILKKAASLEMTKTILGQRDSTRGYLVEEA